MIFDINNHLNSVNTRTSQSRSGSVPADAKAASANTNPAANAATDTVELSDQARSMARLQQTLAQTPEVDMDKVESIKRAIAEGKFEINAERIAENMLNQDDLLG